MLSSSKIFLCSLIAFIAGIAVASWIRVDANLEFPLFMIACVFFTAGVLVWPRKRISAGLFIFSMLIIGVWRYQLALTGNSADFIARFYDEKVKIEGIIEAEPEESGSGQNLTLHPSSINGENKKWKGLALVKTMRAPKYHKNDEISLECKLKEPKPIEEFDYGRYLAAKRIYALCYPVKITIVKSAPKNSFYARLAALKNSLKNAIEQGMREPEAGLASALTLGGQGAVDKGVQDDFARTGLAHVISISGSHMSILGAIAMFIFIFIGLSRRPASLAAALFIIVYTMMIGAPAAAVRSAIMGIVILAALALGRIKNSINSLTLAAVLMLAVNPLLLRDDIGFQLSFLATAGLALMYSPLDAKLSRIKFLKRAPQLFRSTIALSLSALAFTLPVTLYHFQALPLLTIPANLAIAWVLPFELAAILAGATVAALVPALSFFALIPAWASTAVVINIAHYLSILPFAAISFTPGSAKIASGIYIFLFCGLAGWTVYAKKRKALRYAYSASKKTADEDQAKIVEMDIEKVEKKTGLKLE
jgi:competence protein ComEC